MPGPITLACIIHNVQCFLCIFHLEYPKQTKNVMFFFQDYIVTHPDSMKRPGTYLAVVSDIKKLASEHDTIH